MSAGNKIHEFVPSNFMEFGKLDRIIGWLVGQLLIISQEITKIIYV